MIKICFVSHSAGLGGAETALLEAINALSKKGATCHVLLPYQGPLCDELAKLKVPFLVVKYKPWTGNERHEGKSWGLQSIHFLISLVMVIPTWMAILRWRSTIVYTNTTTIFTGALAAFLARRPHIWHIHEFGWEDHRFIYFCGRTFSVWLISRLSALCIANSKAVADVYMGRIPATRLKVVYQSVSIPTDYGANGGGEVFRCLIAGKIWAGKGQEDAIKAVAELVKKGMQIELYIIGDGNKDYINRMKEIISKKGIGENVIFTGYRDDAYKYMCNADVVVVCSRSEAFGRVTIEGMLAGKPVIGTRSGATPELIKDGFNGFLYTPGDYKELAGEIAYLYEHRSEARLMGKTGREWASVKFTQERYGEDLMRLCLDISKAKAAGGNIRQ